MKMCSKCSETKPFSEFNKRRGNQFQSYCRSCQNAVNAAWSSNNADAVRARTAAWHAANKEAKRVSNAAHYAANKEAALAHSATRRARKLGLGGDLTIAQETEMRQSATHCAMCSEELVRTEGLHHPRYPHLDHITPLKVGGQHSIANVRMVCRECNLRRPKDGSDNKES